MRDNPSAGAAVAKSLQLNGVTLESGAKISSVLTDNCAVVATDMGSAGTDVADSDSDNEGPAAHDGKPARGSNSRVGAGVGAGVGVGAGAGAGAGASESKGPEGFHIFYRNVEGRKRFIDDLSRAENTWTDVSERIVAQEWGAPNTGLEAVFFSKDGSPLLGEPADTTKTLEEWGVNSADEYWAILCPKVCCTSDTFCCCWGLAAHSADSQPRVTRTTHRKTKGSIPTMVTRKSSPRDLGERCVAVPAVVGYWACSFLWACQTHTICVYLEDDTVHTLKRKIFAKSKVPVQSLALVYGSRALGDDDASLASVGLQRVRVVRAHVASGGAHVVHTRRLAQQNSTLQFTVSRRGTVALSGGFNGNFYAQTCLPLVPQSDGARASFYSVLYTVVNHMIRNSNDGRKILEEVRQLSRGCLPLVCALHHLSSRRQLRPAHKHALVEGLYVLFRRIVPVDATLGECVGGTVVDGWWSSSDRDLAFVTAPDDDVSDHGVFSNAIPCWAFILQRALRYVWRDVVSVHVCPCWRDTSVRTTACGL